MRVRRNLWLLLAAAAALSAAALLLAPSGPSVVQSVAQSDGEADPTRFPRETVKSIVDAPPSDRFSNWAARAPIEPATRDPFGLRAPQPAQPAPAAVAPVPPAPPPLPAADPPGPPPMNHRYFGSMNTPEGQVLYYVTDGPGVAAARAGEGLSSGWRIESMDAREIRLVHPPSATPAVIAIPPPPQP